MHDQLAQHRPALLGLAYRITGDAWEAEEIAQEALTRAVARLAPDDARPVRPWLIAVTANLARDHLRRRRRARYFGSWLPSPIDTGGPHAAWAEVGAPGGAQARIEGRQSVTYAWLVAVEALTPQQRCVLVLREVYELDVAETAAALGMSAANVKVTHHRARRLLAGAAPDTPATPARRAAAEAALARLFEAMIARDLDAVQALLADDVEGYGDGGGVSPATPRPHLGRLRVARALVSAKLHAWPLTFERVEINGEPAYVLELPLGVGDGPYRVVARVDVDDDGRVRRYQAITAPAKLRALSHLWTQPISAGEAERGVRRAGAGPAGAPLASG